MFQRCGLNMIQFEQEVVVGCLTSPQILKLGKINHGLISPSRENTMVLVVVCADLQITELTTSSRLNGHSILRWLDSN